MALLPRATASLAETGGGLGGGSDLICILSCMQQGPLAQIGLFANVADILAKYGYGEGLEFASHYVSHTKKQVMFAGLNPATPGALGNVDLSGVTGTSVITFTGVPFDDEEIVVKVTTGGTIATAGIVFQVSRDSGQSYSGFIRLGTAVLYLIPNTGVTINFAAGTLIAGDIAKQWCSSPKWDVTALQAAFAALKASPLIPRLVIVLGDTSTPTMAQNVIDAITDYENSAARFSHVLCSARDFLQPAKMLNPAGVQTVAVAVGKTYTRSAGSFVTDGFQVGQTMTVTGCVTAGNNGTKTITNVTALVITVSDTCFLDGAATGVVLSAVEGKSAWKAAVEVIVGNTPTTQKISHRTVMCAGRARRTSPVNGTRKRRPSSWWIAMRAMHYGIQVSPSEVQKGGLDGLTTVDLNGQLEEFDERVDGGILAIRMACLTTVDDQAGVFVALPLTLDTDNAPLSRLPVGLVGDLLCRVAKQETTLKLGSRIGLNADGTPQESECQRIEQYVLGRMKAAVLTPDADGPKVSSVFFTFPRQVVLSTPGAVVPCVAGYVPLGYLEQITTVVNVVVGG